LDDFLLVYNGLLRCVFKIAHVCRLGTKMLHAGKNIVRLRQVGLPQLRRPVEFVIHHFKHIGVTSHGLDALVPRLLVDQRGIFFCRDVAIGQHDITWRSRCRQDLRQQRIGIKCDWAQQGIKLSGSQKRRRGSLAQRRRGGWICRGWRFLGGRGNRNQQSYTGDHGA
jgi:hypothetical protein